MVFDRKVTFVGSFNLDPRSVDLNSEMGFLVESPSLAEAVASSIENDIAPGRADDSPTGRIPFRSRSEASGVKRLGGWQPPPDL